MLLDLLSQYLENVEDAIRDLQRYDEEILAKDRRNLRIRVRFLTGFLLELNEAVIVEADYIKHLGYRYHFQDRQNNLAFSI